MPPLPALDLRQQCAGFAYGLQTVDALIRSGIARTVLLVGTDVHSSLIPWSERSWEILYGREEGPLGDEELAWNNRFRHLTVLFGDAAGAMVFRAGEDGGRGILGSSLYVDGDNMDILFVPGVGSAYRPFVDAAMIESGDSVPAMDGRAVFKLAVTRMPKVTKEVLVDCGYTLDDLDLVIMHQANLRINEAAQKFSAPRRRQGPQQHPEVWQHDLGDPAAGLFRGSAGRQGARGLVGRVHRPGGGACTMARF